MAKPSVSGAFSKKSENRELRMNSWLQLVSNMLILRRTKQDKVKSGIDENGIDLYRDLVSLPEKNIKLIEIKLAANEQVVYKNIFDESKDKVNKFLKNQQRRLITGAKQSANSTKFSEILVYLLRLRQACSHLFLLSECISVDDLDTDVDINQSGDGLNELMGNLSINETKSTAESLDSTAESVNINDILKDDVKLEVKECFTKSYSSTKLGKLIDIVRNITTANDDDKIVIVSQWTSVLTIIAYHLDKLGLNYCEINGKVNLITRNEIVQDFNNKEETHTRVMLLSLAAGGVGLNLVGANHLFLFDIHWNPALERQAIDRIFRIGQVKNVFIYKFLVKNTIEQRIFDIQQFKIDLAKKVCSEGTDDVSTMSKTAGNAKLTINDIKLLFQDFD